MLCIVCRCEEISEQSCSTDVTNTHYAPGYSILINNSYADLIAEINRIQRDQIPGAGGCSQLLDALSCVIRWPACNTDFEQLIPICETQCPTINRQIMQCLMNLPSADFPLVTSVFSEFECTSPESYYNFPSQYIEEFSINCLMISKL